MYAYTIHVLKKPTKNNNTCNVRNLCIILYSRGLADAATLRKKKPQVYQMLVIPLKQIVQSIW